MTDKPRKPAKPRHPAARPLTFRDVLGEAFAAAQAKRKRRAELFAAGFRPLKDAP